jgi:hypothetical protein
MGVYPHQLELKMTNPNLTDALKEAQQDNQTFEPPKQDELTATELDDIAGGLLESGGCKGMACGVY